MLIALLAAVAVTTGVLHAASEDAHAFPERPESVKATPINDCQADLQERPAWPLNDQVRVVTKCAQLADFTEVGGVLQLPLQGDQTTAWFRATGAAYASEWVFKNVPPPVALRSAPLLSDDLTTPVERLKFRDHGFGTNLYGPRSISARPLTFRATLPPTATGTVELRGFGSTGPRVSVSNGVAVFDLGPLTLPAGIYRLTAAYLGDATHAPVASEPYVVTVGGAPPESRSDRPGSPSGRPR